MKITSDSSIVLDNIYRDLIKKNISVQKTTAKPVKGSQSSEVDIIAILIDSISIAGGLLSIVSYLENLARNQHQIILDKKNTEKMTYSQFKNLTEEEKYKILNESNIIINRI